jgi:hypothetical protein
MSNQVCLMSTEFKDVDGVTYGFRLYDDYSNVYDNNAERFIEDDMILLQIAVNASKDNSQTQEVFDYLLEHKKGITINNTWYEWEDINHIVVK